MLDMRYGGREGVLVYLDEAIDRVVVRTKSKQPFQRERLGRAARQALVRFDEEIRFDDAGVCILRVRRKASLRVRDETRAVLKRDNTLRFAGRVLRFPGSDRAVAYTENLYVKLRPDVPSHAARRLFADAGLRAKRRLGSARNAWLCEPKIEGIGRAVFYLAGALLADRRVERCHPETAALAVRRAAGPEQWHLQPTTIDGEYIDKGHANVAAAWEHTRGEGTTIAVIDDGIDVDHPELRGRVVWQFNTVGRTRNARPRRADDVHGTCCAGVALGAGLRASGVAPRAKLLPIRSKAGLGTASEAESFTWAVDHGADVISCSWGPPDDGEVTALPDLTRDAIDDALIRGRHGRGTPIVWAAGNGGESIELDGYAAYDGVIAVGACDYRGRRCVYSDFGPSVFCVFPSGRDNDGTDHGIFTIDRRGRAGYNEGDRGLGDPRGNYTNDFSGTSSATPGVAGVIALMLSVAPELHVDNVTRLLARACEKIDRAHGNYVRGRSTRYGYGRVDASRAVRLAQEWRRR